MRTGPLTVLAGVGAIALLGAVAVLVTLAWPSLGTTGLLALVVVGLGAGAVLLAVVLRARAARVRVRELTRERERLEARLRAAPAAAPVEQAQDAPRTGSGADPESDPAPAAGTDPAPLVTADDPVAALLLGAVGYERTPRALEDGQPDPGLRLVRAEVASGSAVRLEQLAGAQVVAAQVVPVTALPLDRAAVRPRPRTHPAAAAVLEVVGDDDPAPTPGAPGPDGVPRTRVAVPGPDAADRQAVRDAARRHRLVTVTAAVGRAPLRWGALVLELTAAGVPCLLPASVLERIEGLGPRLRATLVADGSGSVSAEVVAAAPIDDLALARLAAEQRRAAWADHDLALGWGRGDVTGGPRLTRRPRPSVSVVLPTRRPALVATVLGMLAAQREASIEVVVALHGAHDPEPARAALAAAGLAGSVLALPTDVPLGAVLNAAVARTSAPLVLKWDDDDLYGPHVVEDLVLAHLASGAALVGKAAEFVHLDASQRTVWRTPAGAEGPSRTLAGGTFLTPRSVLESLGGYPPVRRAVDHHLKARLLDEGGSTYRTHGFGFVLRRHGAGHTWDAGDDRFLGQAVAVFDGIPEVIGLEAAAGAVRVPVPPGAGQR